MKLSTAVLVISIAPVASRVGLFNPFGRALTGSQACPSFDCDAHTAKPNPPLESACDEDEYRYKLLHYSADYTSFTYEVCDCEGRSGNALSHWTLFSPSCNGNANFLTDLHASQCVRTKGFGGNTPSVESSDPTCGLGGNAVLKCDGNFENPDGCMEMTWKVSGADGLGPVSALTKAGRECIGLSNAACLLGPACGQTCTPIDDPTPICGDSNIDPNEQCDDGNTIDGDGCSSACVKEFCGDNKVNNGGTEECDDGNNTSGDGCSANCKREAVCGNNRIEGTEGCDDGNTQDGDGCSSTCVNEFCGDNNVNNGGTEECDDGNNMNGDGCSSTCVNEICGDDVVNNGGTEECDDGNTVDGDGCSSTCVKEICGDNIVNNAGTEECDDGNTVDGDGCSSTCVKEICGDDIINNAENGVPTETCDPPNFILGGTCDDDCCDRCVASNGLDFDTLPLPPTMSNVCFLDIPGRADVFYSSDCSDGASLLADYGRSLSAVDACFTGTLIDTWTTGCDLSHSRSIIVVNDPPVISIVGENNFQCPSEFKVPQASATDDCTGAVATVLAQGSPSEILCNSSFDLKWTADDGCSQSSAAETITVGHAVAPIIHPSETAKHFTCPSQIDLSASAVSKCGDSVAVPDATLPSTIKCGEPFALSWMSAADICGNSGTDTLPDLELCCSFEIFEQFSGVSIITTISLEIVAQGVLVTVKVTDPHKTGDIRGVFFHVDAAKFAGAEVVADSDLVTQVVKAENSVQRIANDVIMKGDKNRHIYDFGLEIGSQGMAKDDVQEISFTVTNVSVEDFNGEFGLRLTSVTGSNGAGRQESSKITGFSTCCPQQH